METVANYSVAGLNEKEVRALRVFSHLSRREAITIGEMLSEMLRSCGWCDGRGNLDDTHYTNHGEGMIERHRETITCRHCEGTGFNVYSENDMAKAFRVMLDIDDRG